MNRLIKSWEEFKETLLFKERFFYSFNPSVSESQESKFTSLFIAIYEAFQLSSLRKSMRGALNQETKAFYRARLWQDFSRYKDFYTGSFEEKTFKIGLHTNRSISAWVPKEPENPAVHHTLKKELGPPPASKVSPGRMNISGIPAFYLSNSRNTAIRELRPEVGSIIGIGEFKMRWEDELKLLDLTEPPSEKMVNNRERYDFLNYLIEDLSFPIVQADSDLSYLPSQFIVEFVRKYCDVQGVKYASTLVNKGYNYAFFFSSPEFIDGKTWVVNDSYLTYFELTKFELVHVKFYNKATVLFPENSIRSISI